MEQFDSVIIGEIARDTNVDYDGSVVKATGGAVYYAGLAAANMGHRVAVVPKADIEGETLRREFGEGISVYPVHSRSSFVTTNTYTTPTREQRISEVSDVAEPYRPEELPAVQAKLWYLAGLAAGVIPDALIPLAAERGAVAMDAQTMLRHVEHGQLVLRDWNSKRELLPLIRFLKTDAAEAEVLTGCADRGAAARQLCRWGAGEVLITHHTEILACDGNTLYTCPLKPGNLSGRTGRGDTAFSCYIHERLTGSISEALSLSAALTSLKMERPGPFRGSRAEVLACQQNRGFPVKKF